MEPKKPRIPAEKTQSARRQITALLNEKPLSAKQISMSVGLPEKEVYPHLEHIRRTLQQKQLRLFISPAKCKKCGFVFKKREKLTRPSKCPVCRGEAIEEPVFAIR